MYNPSRKRCRPFSNVYSRVKIDPLVFGILCSNGLLKASPLGPVFFGTITVKPGLKRLPEPLIIPDGNGSVEPTCPVDGLPIEAVDCKPRWRLGSRYASAPSPLSVLVVVVGDIGTGPACEQRLAGIEMLGGSRDRWPLRGESSDRDRVILGACQAVVPATGLCVVVPMLKAGVSLVMDSRAKLRTASLAPPAACAVTRVSCCAAKKLPSAIRGVVCEEG